MYSVKGSFNCSKLSLHKTRGQSLPHVHKAGVVTRLLFLAGSRHHTVLLLTRAEPVVSGYQNEGSLLGLLLRTPLVNRPFLFMIFLPLSHKFSQLQNMAIFSWALAWFGDSAKENYLIWKVANGHRILSVQTLCYPQNTWSIFWLFLVTHTHSSMFLCQSRDMKHCQGDIMVPMPCAHTFPSITFQLPPF